MENSLSTDKKMRTTTRGPHKDDMSFFVNFVNVRNFGSQGQQRTCALSLKLAELDFIKEETGEKGILLLDDVMSELDEERRNYLIRSLKENQIFVTATDLDENLVNNYSSAGTFLTAPPSTAASASCPLTQRMAKSAIVRGRTSASQGVGLHEHARVDEADGGDEGVAGQVRQDVWQG